MSYNFINKAVTIGTTLADIYTCGGDSGVLFGLSLANNLSTAITVTITLYSNTGSTTTDIVAPNTVIDVGETLIPIGGVQKMVFNKDDKLQVECSDADGVDVIASVIEFNDYI